MDGFKYKDLCHNYSGAVVSLIEQSAPNLLISANGKAKEIKEYLQKLIHFSQVTLTDPANIEAMSTMGQYYGLDIDDDLLFYLLPSIKSILEEGKRIAEDEGRIDFNDMIWLPHVWNLHPKKYLYIFTDECLPYDMSILLADGTSKSIGEIVENKLQLEVLSYNTDSGKQEKCKITKWSKTPNFKKLLKIKTESHNGKTNFVVCTYDHKIWANEKWLHAEDVKVGMTLQIETSAEKTQKYKISKNGKDNLRLEIASGKASDCPVEVKVTEIIETTIRENWVYDITVEKCHNFYANGILVHNCQDVSSAQLSIILKSRAQGGRIIFVGDPMQSLYGFAGAHPESFWEIKKQTHATELPLSICFRCPTSVIELAKQIVPQIEARENAPVGIVGNLKESELAAFLKEGDMILCRITAPLIDLCINLIGQKIPARVKGRDIGKALTSIVTEISRMKYFTYVKFQQFSNTYENDKIKKLKNSKNPESRIQSLSDRLRGIRICYENFNAESISHLNKEIENLFSDEQASITLSTVHKAKGLENSRVFIIKPTKMPLIWKGQQTWEQHQEMCCKYVALTRCKDALYFVQEG